MTKKKPSLMASRLIRKAISKLMPEASRSKTWQRKNCRTIMKQFKFDWLVLPLLGFLAVVIVWQISSSSWAKELPSPGKTWAASKSYILEPFAKRGEMDQGILRFTWYSLKLVAKGYLLALVIGTPIGFLLGLSNTFTKTFDPIIQVLRPVSPLAWLPLGLVLFLGAGKQASELGA